MKYVVIIPAKDEESIIGYTLDLLINQTLKPLCILVIDNDSIDNTAEIIKGYSAKYDFIQYLNFKGEKSYSLGGKIVKIFNAGQIYLNSLNIKYDYIVKLDADIYLESNVFERISKYLENGNYGIVSPLAYILHGNKRIYSSTPDWHTSGDFKVYNKYCLESIGGLKEDLGWDCADNIMAIEAGFKTKVFRDINYEQKRPIGKYSVIKGYRRQGLGAYNLRYNFFYLILKVFHDLIKPPVILGAINYLIGYFSGYFKLKTRELNRSQAKILNGLLWDSFFYRLRNNRFYLTQVFKRNNN